MAEQRTYFTTVVFVDVSGSSKLYKRIGNEQANRRIGETVARLVSTAVENRGVVIKTIGDEVMCHFPQADDAFRATIAFQHVGEETLAVRVGIACGDVIEQDRDIFGQAVNDAAAVAKISQGSQIITTEQFKSLLSPDNACQLSVFDRVKLKGGQDSTGLYRIDWKSQQEGDEGGSEHTVIMASAAALQTQLVLSFGQFEGKTEALTLTTTDVPFHIGRDPSTCQLTLSTGLASRDHCHIDYQHGSFIVCDHSTNGTYVKSGSGPQVYLRRGELPLMGSGEIGLGEQVSDENRFVIKFSS